MISLNLNTEYLIWKHEYFSFILLYHYRFMVCLELADYSVYYPYLTHEETEAPKCLLRPEREESFLLMSIV